MILNDQRSLLKNKKIKTPTKIGFVVLAGSVILFIILQKVIAITDRFIFDKFPKSGYLLVRTKECLEL